MITRRILCCFSKFGSALLSVDYSLKKLWNSVPIFYCIPKILFLMGHCELCIQDFSGSLSACWNCFSFQGFQISYNKKTKITSVINECSFFNHSWQTTKLKNIKTANLEFVDQQLVEKTSCDRVLPAIVYFLEIAETPFLLFWCPWSFKLKWEKGN